MPSITKAADKSISSNIGPGMISRYSGPWNTERAAHLLRRTTYGSTISDINETAKLSMEEVVELLLADLPLPEEPINYYYEEDPYVAVGESWIDKKYINGDNPLINARRRSLSGWTIKALLSGGINIREKLTLFWSNHFVVQATVVQDPNFIYHHNDLLRKGALGNFRKLVKDVTLSPAMLRYLNGNQNTKNAPNENFARELFELFTIGKGPLAGPGDYTTFTEEDVSQASKILTGWIDQGYYYRDDNPAGAIYVNSRHDTTSKQLSHRFNRTVVDNDGDNEYATLVDIIFEQEEVSRYICRKLYRWFVYYDIDETVEVQIIEPLAQILRENDYEIKPVLKVLLTSDHFYNICSVGPMIKNPIDFIINLLVQFEISYPEDNLEAYKVWSRMAELFAGFGMNYYEPPNVAGWKAYYQEPLFYRTWITAATLPLRQAYTNAIVSGQAKVRNTVLTMDTLKIISQLDNADDPNELIKGLTSFLFPQPLTENQYTFLKSILIPGLPDFEWTVEYNLHLNDPTNEEIKNAVDLKLRKLLLNMLTMPEYYLS